MDPHHHFRARHAPDIDDLAATFIEQEVGRYDWKNNWTVYKSKPNLAGRVQAWLDMLNVRVGASELIAAVDQLVSRNTGRWV